MKKIYCLLISFMLLGFSAIGQRRIINYPDYSIYLCSNGTVWGAGLNNGQYVLGDTISGSYNSLIQIKGLNNIISLTNNAALKNDGTVWYWSYNSRFCKKGSPKVKQLSNISDVISIAEDNNSNLIMLKRDSSVWFISDTACTPKKLNSLHSIIQIEAGEGGNLAAVQSNGDLYMWGDDYFGEVGVGTFGDLYFDPIKLSISNVQQVSLGNSYTLCLKKDGTLWAWGHNNDGQLGDNSLIDRHLPVRIASGPTNIKSLFSTGVCSFAICKDSSVYGWGLSDYGILGDTTLPLRVLKPILIKNLINPKYIASHAIGTVFIKQDDSFWAMGLNSNGKMGIGTTGGVYKIPVQIPITCNSLTSANNETFEFNNFKVFPNPFNETTTISFSLPDNSRKACLKIYDLRGLLLKSIPLSSRANSTEFLANEFSSGMYIVVIESDGVIKGKGKLMIAK